MRPVQARAAAMTAAVQVSQTVSAIKGPVNRPARTFKRFKTWTSGTGPGPGR